MKKTKKDVFVIENLKNWNQGNVAEVVAILVHLFHFSYGLPICNKLGKYNYEPVFLSAGNNKDTQKKRRLDEILFRAYIEDEYGKMSPNEFCLLLENNIVLRKIAWTFNINPAGSGSKADFYRGDLGISVKGYQGETPSIFNKGSHIGLLKMCNRLKDIETIKVNTPKDILTENYSLKIDHRIKEFMRYMSCKSGTLNKNYNSSTGEYGYFYSEESWREVKPIIYYTLLIGTRSKDSFNTAHALLDIIDPFDIQSYNYFYDYEIFDYIEENKDNWQFEMRSSKKDKKNKELLNLTNEELIPMGYYKHFDSKKKIWKIYNEFVIRKSKSVA